MDQWLTGRPALRLLDGSGPAGSGNGVLARTGAEVLAAAGRGFGPEDVFLCAPFDAEAVQLQDRCRFVAGGLDDLLFLERLAEDSGSEALFRVGLRLRAPDLPPAENDAFLPEDLSALAREIRQLRGLTVRGCFFGGSLSGVHGEALGRFFRAGYEAAKRMTVALPCAMPYLCFEGAASAVRENAERHPETLDACLRALDIVTMQNETAFYARLFLS